MVTDVAVVVGGQVCRVVTAVHGGTVECLVEGPAVAPGVSVVRGACVAAWPAGLDVILEVDGGCRRRRHPRHGAVNHPLRLPLRLQLLNSNQQVIVIYHCCLLHH